MKSSLLILGLALGLTCLLNPVDGKSLSGVMGLKSEVPQISEKGFSMALLGSKPASHEQIREFQGLIKDIREEVQVAEKAGLALSRPVRILLLMDTKFPARDLWTCFGITPDDVFFTKLEEDALLVNACTSEIEQKNYTNDFFEKYSFISRIGFPSASWYGDMRTDLDPQVVKDFIVKLKGSIDRPLVEVSRLYDCSGQAVYNNRQATIWVPVSSTKEYHRFQGTINHETGHHFFAALVDRVLDKNNLRKKVPIASLKFLNSFHLTAENELFADYMVVANKNTNIIDIKDWKEEKASDEQKRYFSKDRTLEEFLAGSMNASSGHFFTEEHNVLNPIRTLLWHLKLKIGIVPTNRLVVAMMDDRLKGFYGQDVSAYKHSDMNNIAPGAFSLEEYPLDIVTSNQRVFRSLARTAGKMLSAEQKTQFDVVAASVMGKYLPK
ncbi:MAG: hypothetical protein WA705_14950 [Candidatus Ozemobacteraceae bacterium]